MDVTHNYWLGDLTNVMTALSLLRHAEGGRYQVRTAAESVYWSQNSTRRSGKAYSKGAHMRFLAKRGRAFIEPDEFALVDGLLRLELSLRRHFFSRVIDKPWYLLTEKELNAEHEKYFAALVGRVEVSEMTDMRNACVEAALRLGLSEGQGRAAYLSWNTIRAVGFAVWRAESAKATMYRHKKILHEAGLSYGDFQARNVVPIRRRRIVLGEPVQSWAELRKVA
jgi:II/X family phage/plasmid replication protein